MTRFDDNRASLRKKRKKRKGRVKKREREREGKEKCDAIDANKRFRWGDDQCYIRGGETLSLLKRRASSESLVKCRSSEITRHFLLLASNELSRCT